MPYRRTDKVVRRLAARQQAIMAAAQAVAAEGGMAAVQIAPIAERAAIAAGTVYRYFPAKTELVGALVESVAADELAAVRVAADAAPGPLSALAGAIVTFAARALNRRRLAFAVIAEPVDADVNAQRLGFRSALADEFERRIVAAMERKLLPDQDTRLAATALLGALIEGLIGPLAARSTDRAAMRNAVQTLTLFALRGLGVFDARARGIVVQTALPDMDDAE